jgi:hypothetical protein
MLLSLNFLTWGAIVTFGVFLAASGPLVKALRQNWRSLVFILLLALVWRLPFENHFFHGLEYEDSYIYPVAARYLAFNAPHIDPSRSRFLTTVCAVGSWESCRNPEISSGHFVGYPFMIAVAARVFGYSAATASWISVAASLITVVLVFLVGKLLDPGGLSGIAGALLFSGTPVFALQAGCTYAEPVSNALVVGCLLIFLYLFSPSLGDSWPAMVVTWLALTFTALLAIVVKRENVIIVPVLLLVSVAFRMDHHTIGASKRRLTRLAASGAAVICGGFALNQLRLLTVIRQEQSEYSLFPFGIEMWRMMIPVFLKGYLSFGWYLGSALLVLIAVLGLIRSKRPCLYIVSLFASYLLLYMSHVRSYYELHGGAITELETLRYSMNVSGLWSIMGGLGLSTLTVRLCRTEPGQSAKSWTRLTLWACLVSWFLCSWVATARLKEDMVAAESEVRFMPAEGALQAILRSGNPDTFVISLEPLVVQMVAQDPVNVIDFKDLSTELLHELRGENPNATFFYLEQDIYNDQIDRERYRKSFEVVDEAHKRLLFHGDRYSVFEVLYGLRDLSEAPKISQAISIRCNARLRSFVSH